MLQTTDVVASGGLSRRELSTAVASALRAGGLTSIAGTTSYVAILVTSVTFVSTGSDAEELRSLLVPLTLLFGGASMLFSVPAQIASARGSHFPGGASIRQWAVWTGVICVVFVVLAAGCWLALSSAGRGLLAGTSNPGRGAAFLSFMALGYLPFAASDFIEGYLRGKGRFGAASSLVVVRAAVTCVGYAVAVHAFAADPLALPLFYAVGGATTLVLGAFLAIRWGRVVAPAAAVSAPGDTRRLVRTVGLPVLASYILLSAVVSIQIFGVNLGLGHASRLAFSGMLMVQTLCVVAATGAAAGVSTEVVRRVSRDHLGRAGAGAMIARASTVIFAIEALLLIVFLCLHDTILDVLLAGVNTTSGVRVGAIALVIAALLTANNVFVLTVLEEIGLASLSLALNAVYFVVLIGVTFGAALIAGTFTALGVALIALSVVASIALRILIRRLPRGPIVT